MNHINTFKNRTNETNATEEIKAFFENIKFLTVSALVNDDIQTDGVEYFYVNGAHIAIVSHNSSFAGKVKNNTKFKAFYQEGVGKGAKKLYADITCEVIDGTNENVQELAKTHKMINKMIGHKATFLNLTLNQAKLVLTNSEIYDLDSNLKPTFAKNAPNGRERFENSRHILMTYLDREVIFSVIVENDTYYCLAKENSNKMEHIKALKTCKIYDGKGVEFETQIDIVNDKKDEIFEKLVNTNNAFFKQNDGLVALSFKRK